MLSDDGVSAFAQADGAGKHVAGLGAQGVGDVVEFFGGAVADVAVARGAWAGDDEAVGCFGELADLAVG